MYSSPIESFDELFNQGLVTLESLEAFLKIQTMHLWYSTCDVSLEKLKLGLGTVPPKE